MHHSISLRRIIVGTTEAWKRSIRLVLFLFTALSTGISAGANASTGLTGLTTEHRKDPLGIDAEVPRFSWRITSDVKDQRQSGYQILIASRPEFLTIRKADVWNSQRVHSSQSVLVTYGGRPLASRERCWWIVRIWDKNGKVTEWSKPAYFEMGLLRQEDWKAAWIKPLIEFEEYSHPSPYFRKEFKVQKPVASARLYATSRGLYEFHINGKRVGDHYFTPGYTSYGKRLQYQVYDVTSLIRPGVNATGAVLGNGWYRAFRPNNTPLMQHQPLELLAQLEVVFHDGTIQLLATDESWKVNTGPLLMSEMYNGEIYDSRLELEGWNKAGYDDSQWHKSVCTETRKDNLVAITAEPVKKIQDLAPREILFTPQGDTVLDMGQNMVGWCKLRIKAPRGTVIKLRHAEVLDQNGNFYTANLRTAKQEIIYICKGGESAEVFEPRFSFQGFRYVSISGHPGVVTKDMITGVVLHSDLARTGSFTCDNPLVNQLQRNIVWSQKGNFLDVPTDCPQRDERLGWTADLWAFAPTAYFNMGSAAFITKWLKDLAAEQYEDGRLPNVIPNEPYNKINIGAVGWADAATIVPWDLYVHYGDTGILADMYSTMKGWVDFMVREAKKSVDGLYRPRTFQFNDWLAYTSSFPNYQGATTDTDFLANVFYYHSLDILVKSATILGNEQDVGFYSEILKKIKDGFNNEFVSPNGRLSPNTQTAYVLALSFGLLPDHLKLAAAQRLADDVNKFGHITTGFLGVAHISHVLTDHGHVSEAYKLLTREKYPSWLYPVTKGATTIWERWDGIKPDGSFQTPNGNSFNHYAYGAIGDWLYKAVAGINPDPASPGYKRVILKPHPYGEMNDVKASYDSPYGEIASAWTIDGSKFRWEISIPPNTTAEIFAPSTANDLSLNGETTACVAVRENEAAPYHFLQTRAGAGKYVIETTLDLR